MDLKPNRIAPIYLVILMALCLAVCDQLIKWWVLQHYVLHLPVAYLPFFNMYLAHNSGAAFSFLHQAGGWQNVLFVVIACGVTFVLLKESRTQRSPVLLVGSVLILGGAWGNVIDRLRWGYVIDFLQFYYANWYFPTFNVADAFITCGAILWLWSAVYANSTS